MRRLASRRDAPARPAEVRFYFDADVLGLAKVVARLRNDATYPGDPGASIHRRVRPPCLITDPATPDRLWIPDVARQGWLIITRDSRIQDHRAEVSAVREHGAKMVALTGKDARSTWEQLEVFMRQWRGIDDLVDLAGPFIWRATRSGMSRVLLD
jgi:PIN like domain